MNDHVGDQRTELEAPGGVRILMDRLYSREHLWFLPLSWHEPPTSQPPIPAPPPPSGGKKAWGSSSEPAERTAACTVAGRRYRLGLSAYACRWGIEVYFIENIAAVGTLLPSGDRLATVETEKTVLDLYAPFECRVSGVNQEVVRDPSIITFDNYGTGWIMELEGEPSGLWSAEAYAAYLATLPPPQCFSGT